jgi:hypothetical protein
MQQVSASKMTDATHGSCETVESLCMPPHPHKGKTQTPFDLLWGKNSILINSILHWLLNAFCMKMRHPKGEALIGKQIHGSRAENTGN